MALKDALICSSHTISGVMPGGPVAARHGFEARVAACAAAGYAGMCLHFRDHLQQKAAGHGDGWMRGVLRRHGMADVSLEFLTGWFLTGTAAAQARADEAAAFAAARAWGARVLNAGGDFEGRGLPVRQMRDAFRALCDRAAGEGLSVALEIVPFSNVADVGIALEIVEGTANGGLVIDAWHVFRGGIPLPELEGIPAARILSVQINDAAVRPAGPLAEDTRRRLPCGEGVFDLCGFLAALDRAGAAVAPSVEIISPDIAALPVEEAARRSHAGARAVLDRALALRGSEGRRGGV